MGHMQYIEPYLHSTTLESTIQRLFLDDEEKAVGIMKAVRFGLLQGMVDFSMTLTDLRVALRNSTTGYDTRFDAVASLAIVANLCTEELIDAIVRSGILEKELTQHRKCIARAQYPGRLEHITKWLQSRHSQTYSEALKQLSHLRLQVRVVARFLDHYCLHKSRKEGSHLVWDLSGPGANLAAATVELLPSIRLVRAQHDRRIQYEQVHTLFNAVWMLPDKDQYRKLRTLYLTKNIRAHELLSMRLPQIDTIEPLDGLEEIMQPLDITREAWPADLQDVRIFKGRFEPLNRPETSRPQDLASCHGQHVGDNPGQPLQGTALSQPRNSVVSADYHPKLPQEHSEVHVEQTAGSRSFDGLFALLEAILREIDVDQLRHSQHTPTTLSPAEHAVQKAAEEQILNIFTPRLVRHGDLY